MKKLKMKYPSKKQDEIPKNEFPKDELPIPQIIRGLF